MKHRNPYASVQAPAFLKIEGEHTYFTFLGITYRTDSIRYRIEGLDGKTWNRTSSARVYEAAKQILAQTSEEAQQSASERRVASWASNY
jgi:hypothetical protein